MLLLVPQLQLMPELCCVSASEPEAVGCACHTTGSVFVTREHYWAVNWKEPLLKGFGVPDLFGT